MCTDDILHRSSQVWENKIHCALMCQTFSSLTFSAVSFTSKSASKLYSPGQQNGRTLTCDCCPLQYRILDTFCWTFPVCRYKTLPVRRGWKFTHGFYTVKLERSALWMNIHPRLSHSKTFTMLTLWQFKKIKILFHQHTWFPVNTWRK